MGTDTLLWLIENVPEDVPLAFTVIRSGTQPPPEEQTFTEEVPVAMPYTVSVLPFKVSWDTALVPPEIKYGCSPPEMVTGMFSPVRTEMVFWLSVMFAPLVVL